MRNEINVQAQLLRCLECLLPAPYETHGSREHREEHACCLGCCQERQLSRTLSEERTIEANKPTIQNIDDRHVFPDCLTKGAAQLF